MPTSTITREDLVSPEEAALTEDFIEFLKAASTKRYPTGTLKRFTHGRQTAFVQAEFVIPDAVPESLRVGVFAAPRTYPASIRFANASSATDRERDIRGMSIRVSNLEGENETPGMNAQDFVLNSYPVMVAATAREFLELLRAHEAGGLRHLAYLLTHLKSARIAAAARQHPSCHLDIPYWSTTPFHFGPQRIVKYVVRPTSRQRSPLPSSLTDTYLTDAMRVHLGVDEATFELLVQFYVNDDRTPLEDASVEWQVSDSPLYRVAMIRIPRQRFDLSDRALRGEQMTFNPWHCLPAHRPVGGMNRVRREIYRAMAEFRNSRPVRG